MNSDLAQTIEHDGTSIQAIEVKWYYTVKPGEQPMYVGLHLVSTRECRVNLIGASTKGRLDRLFPQLYEEMVLSTRAKWGDEETSHPGQILLENERENEPSDSGVCDDPEAMGETSACQYDLEREQGQQLLRDESGDQSGRSMDGHGHVYTPASARNPRVVSLAEGRPFHSEGVGHEVYQRPRARSRGDRKEYTDGVFSSEATSGKRTAHERRAADYGDDNRSYPKSKRYRYY